MGCYRCGGPHYKNSCPDQFPAPRTVPPGPGPSAGPEQWKPTDALAFPARRDPAPPSPVYLQVRAGLGMPSPGLPSPLAVPCGWCGAGTYAPCVNPGTGQRTTIHDTRKDAAARGVPA